MAQSMSDIFLSFQQYLETEQDLKSRKSGWSVERAGADCSWHPDHSSRAFTNRTASQRFQSFVRSQKLHLQMSKINSKCSSPRFPENQYYRFHDHWRFVSQRLVFPGGPHDLPRIGDPDPEGGGGRPCLGVCVDHNKGFHIDLDDYLSGLLMLADELSRFAVNSVTSGDYSWPLKISRFVTEMNLGFRLLNLKNDMLR
uniref:Translin n=1 Tax=Ixodes ricinus TaxID=34613 RepID=A0A090XAP4_IXORI